MPYSPSSFVFARDAKMDGTYVIGTGQSVRLTNSNTCMEIAIVSANYAHHVYQTPDQSFMTRRKFSARTLDLFLEVMEGTVYLEFEENNIPELVDLMADLEIMEQFVGDVLAHRIKDMVCNFDNNGNSIYGPNRLLPKQKTYYRAKFELSH